MKSVMKRIKSYKLILINFVMLITINHLNMTMSQTLATKNYVFKNLDSIKKYQIFTQSSMYKNTVFDRVLFLAEQRISNQDIFNDLSAKGGPTTSENSHALIEQKAALLGSITGFIPAVKNQLNFFYILTPGILAAQSEELQKPSEISGSQDWKPELPKALLISDKNITWAEQELIIELDFFVTEFAKIHPLKLQPSAHTFELWIQGLDGWWKKEEFEKWITMFVNIMTKDRKALPVLKFTDKSILFFLSSYIPKMIIAKDPATTSITWDALQKEFPGFAMYTNKALFNFAGDITRTHNASFILRMINENLIKIRKDNPLISQLVEESSVSKNKKKNSLLTLFKGS